MLKRRQDGRPKFHIFLQKSFENASYHGLWSKMPLGSLQEPAKSLPGASQEPFKDPQEHPRAFNKLHAASCEPSQSRKNPKRKQATIGTRAGTNRCLLACVSDFQVPGVRCQVPGIRCQVPGVRCKCQVPGVKCQMPGARCQVSGVKCEVSATIRNARKQ